MKLSNHKILPPDLAGAEYDLFQTGRLRRSTLVSLRWLAIAGQLAALAFVSFVLKFEMQVLPCLLLIGLSCLLNVLIMSGGPLDRRITNFEAGAQLVFDVLQMTGMLYFTGGMENPFALLLLAPVVVAAKTLNKTVYGIMVVLVGVLSWVIMHFHFHLPWYGGAHIPLPKLYLYGSWLALIVGMLFTASYTWRVSAQTRRMSAALMTSEKILGHEKKMAALGGLAAAAAHELGTPLATIAVVAKELTLTAGDNAELKEDAELLVSQAARCRTILQGLARRGDEGDIVHDQLDLPSLIEEITRPFTGRGKEIHIDIEEDGCVPAPEFSRRPELIYSLSNIVENAVDFARQTVWVDARWSEDLIYITVRDDGPGFSASVFSKLGEPYISQRSGDAQKAGGLGLGVFIAKTLLQRIGGAVKFSNADDGGAVVSLSWPRSDKV